MNFQKQFVESFNIHKHEIKADIFSESTNCNNLVFSCKPYGLLLSFKVTEMFGRNNEYTKLRVRISRISEFLDDKHRELLGNKLTEELKNDEFINKLNDAINTEKQRLLEIFSGANKQREFSNEDITNYFKWH